MLPEPSTLADMSTLGSAVSEAIAQRYDESGAARFGITPESFGNLVAAVVLRYASEASEKEQLEMVATLHVGELILARLLSRK